MKRLIGIVTSGFAVLALAGAPVGAAPKQQTVEGSIAAPARHPDGCYTGLQRHATSLGGEESNGAIGWTFSVEKFTWNKNFTLEPTGGVGTVDLDLTFYLGEFATRDEWIANPAPAPPASISFEEHGQPGEKGKVPKGALYGIVCIYLDETAGTALNVPFTYTAGKGVK